MRIDRSGFLSGGFCTRQEKEKKKIWAKDDAAFKAKKGICYTNNNGTTYTYDDLLALTRSDSDTEVLFEKLYGGTPEKVLKGSWDFQKCKRCGTWQHVSARLLGSRKTMLCRYCTPLRTEGRIRLQKDPYDDDRAFYKGHYAEFHPGITTITGCNGIGKTTLIKNIVEELENRGTPHFLFDNLGEAGGERSARNLFNSAISGCSGMNAEKDLVMAVGLLSCSEGERILSALNRFTKNLTEAANGNVSAYGEMYILFDGVDSGLSADFLEDLKEILYEFINSLKERHPLFRCYILITSNSYEACHGTDVYSVAKNRYVPVKGYDAFVKEVRDSREYKVKRDRVLEIKAEIARLPYSFTCNKELLERAERHSGEKIDKDAAVIELGGFKMALHVKTTKGGFDCSTNVSLYRREENGEYKKIPCRDAEIDTWRPADKIEEEMHGYLCKVLFKETKKKKK